MPKEVKNRKKIFLTSLTVPECFDIIVISLPRLIRSFLELHHGWHILHWYLHTLLDLFPNFNPSLHFDIFATAEYIASFPIHVRSAHIFAHLTVVFVTSRESTVAVLAATSRAAKRGWKKSRFFKVKNLRFFRFIKPKKPQKSKF